MTLEELQQAHATLLDTIDAYELEVADLRRHNAALKASVASWMDKANLLINRIKFLEKQRGAQRG